jgi:microcystin-dependent protein
MSSPFVAEIRIFAGNFAPTGWAQCNGQLLPISQNTALFSLLGTFYGGDGKSTFALPDLQGCSPMHQGQGPGLTDRFLGEAGGSETITLLESEMPGHTHAANATPGLAAARDPSNAALARSRNGYAYAPAASLVPMSPLAMGVAGSSFPHNNRQPALVLNFIIAMQGVFPPRS